MLLGCDFSTVGFFPREILSLYIYLDLRVCNEKRHGSGDIGGFAGYAKLAG